MIRIELSNNNSTSETLALGGFIGQSLIYLIEFFLLWIVISSCQSNSSGNQKEMLLECILTNFITPNDNQPGSFLVGQHDHWTLSTSLIIVSYIPDEDIKIHSIQAEEKSRFGQYDIYFYRTELTEGNTEETIQKIANELKWAPYSSLNSKNDNHPPYDPLTIQLVYNYSSNCIVKVISGGNNMQKGWDSKCNLCLGKLKEINH